MGSGVGDGVGRGVGGNTVGSFFVVSVVVAIGSVGAAVVLAVVVSGKGASVVLSSMVVVGSAIVVGAVEVGHMKQNSMNLIALQEPSSAAERHASVLTGATSLSLPAGSLYKVPPIGSALTFSQTSTLEVTVALRFTLSSNTQDMEKLPLGKTGDSQGHSATPVRTMFPPALSLIKSNSIES